MSWWDDIDFLWQELVLVTAFLETLVLAFTIPYVLMSRKESTSTVAWCLFVFFVPLLGSIFFFIFGYQHVNKPLARKQRHKKFFQLTHPASLPEIGAGTEEVQLPPIAPMMGDAWTWQGMAKLAERYGCLPAVHGNQVAFYFEGRPAFDAQLEAIAAARQHVHLEYFIIQPDALGQRFLELLTRKAREGVEIRLLYDAVGSRRLSQAFLQPLAEAGGKFAAFLPLNILRRRVQVNLRDHRKLLIVDGRVAFTGGLNIGDEYLGLVPRFGFWRDTHMRLEGPVVNLLQRGFAENWDFAAEESLKGPSYFPQSKKPGKYTVQVIESGPDRELKSIREMYFAAILRARRSLWIATPYFVPDSGLRDALCLAGRLGLDVRLLGQFHPDKWIPYFAGRHFWEQVLEAGVKVYQYTKGMMHAKVLIVDGEWASVGTANLDNRSLYLNFEVNCQIYSPEAAAELERAFLHDLETSIRLRKSVFAQRPLAGRIVENACRLLSPVL